MLLPPHDPHDQKYVEDMPKFTKSDHGVRIEVVKEEDVVYDIEGNERRKVVHLPYFQTHRHYECGLYTPMP
jgi:mRNA-degrading endonuclease HigB of HigAB toxin-antitoxin module